jgi:hypothetical protein
MLRVNSTLTIGKKEGEVNENHNFWNERIS